VVIRREETSVSVMVDDAGPGVDQDLRDRLFEPFSRGHASHRTQGAGLGLAIAREQATVLGGELWVEPSVMGGARFVVRLPLASESP
jgi:signal transduction histidine kinase